MTGLIAVGTGAFAAPAFEAPSQQVFMSSRHLWLELALPIR